MVLCECASNGDIQLVIKTLLAVEMANNYEVSCVGRPAWDFDAQSQHLLNELSGIVTHWAAEKMLSCRPGLELKTKKGRERERGRGRER